MTQNLPTTSPSPALPTNVPGNRLGRTALFVMAGGLVTSSLMLAIVYFVGGLNARVGDQDLLPVAGMALAIGGVCYCWSLFLAIRAYKSGESATLPLWVMNLATLPLASFGIMCWFPCSYEFVPIRRWSFLAALPVYLPFISFLCISGTVIIRPLLMWFERRRKRLGKPDFTRAQRVPRVVAVYLGYALLAGAIVLPVLLCIEDEVEKVLHNGASLYSTLGTFAPKYNKVQKRTGSRASETYSEFISDTAERILSLEPDNEWHDARMPLLRSGKMSFNRLVRRAHDANTKVAQNALKGILASYPERIADVASEIISTWPKSKPDETLFAAHEIVAHYGSYEQRRDLLKDIQNGSAHSSGIMLPYFTDAPHDVRLIPIFKDLLKSSNPTHHHALEPLIAWLPDDEAEALMEEAWVSNDPLEQLKIRECLIQNPRERALGFAVVMNHAPKRIRREELFRLTQSSDSPLIKTRFIKSLLKLCDDADLTMRRGAVRMLTTTLGFNNQLLEPVLPMYELRHSHRKGRLDILEDPVVDSPAEIQAITVVREKAEAWLVEHEKDADK